MGGAERSCAMDLDALSRSFLYRLGRPLAPGVTIFCGTAGAGHKAILADLVDRLRLAGLGADGHLDHKGILYPEDRLRIGRALASSARPRVVALSGPFDPCGRYPWQRAVKELDSLKVLCLRSGASLLLDVTFIEGAAGCPKVVNLIGFRTLCNFAQAVYRAERKPWMKTKGLGPDVFFRVLDLDGAEVESPVWNVLLRCVKSTNEAGRDKGMAYRVERGFVEEVGLACPL